MNRTRLMVLSGLLVVGSLGLGSSSAQAQYMGGTAPRYYTPGGGFYSGYYYAPQVPPNYYAPRYSAPAPTPAYAAPSRHTGQGSYGNYDPSGRHDRLSRPWLQPLR